MKSPQQHINAARMRSEDLRAATDTALRYAVALTILVAIAAVMAFGTRLWLDSLALGALCP